MVVTIIFFVWALYRLDEMDKCPKCKEKMQIETEASSKNSNIDFWWTVVKTCPNCQFQIKELCGPIFFGTSLWNRYGP